MMREERDDDDPFDHDYLPSMPQPPNRILPPGGYSKAKLPTSPVSKQNGVYPVSTAMAAMSIASGQTGTVNKLVQPSWVLGKDPDPMMQALLENLVAVETALLEIKLKARMFRDSVAFMCRTMTDQASCIARICHDPESNIGASTLKYASAMREAIQESAFSKLCENLELKIFEPIQVNLHVLNEIKSRAHERELLRKKKGSSLVTASTPDFAALTARLFEELAALKQHRYDFLRRLFEGLKSIQKKFFEEVAAVLESADSQSFFSGEQHAPQASNETTVSPPVQPHSTHAITPSPTKMKLVNNTTPSSTKKEVIKATIVNTKFDPDADKIKTDSAPAFSKLSKRKDSEDDRVNMNSQKIILPQSQQLSVDESDDSEFDTV